MSETTADILTLADVTGPGRIVIHADDGRELMVFRGDGTVTLDIEDASEAAAVFVREVRRMTTAPV